MNIDKNIQEMQSGYLKGLDSEYSFNTKKLVERHKAKSADWNRWWAITSEKWVCPCCNRSKPQIVRKNQKDYLQGHLHEHHDHAIEVIQKMFKEYSVIQETQRADTNSKFFVNTCSKIFSAFPNTIICSDCNQADGEAKKKLNLYGKTKYFNDFSFSPREISEFINVENNKEHTINSEKLIEVWQRVKPKFTVRIEIACQLARIAAEKKDWYEDLFPLYTAKAVESAGKSWLKEHKFFDFEQYEPEKLLYKVDKFKGSNDSWRRKESKANLRKPTEPEITCLIQTEINSWEELPDNWKCPCCWRNKIETIRLSKKKNWVFDAVNIDLFDLNSDNSTYARVCIDCKDTAVKIGMEALSCLKVKVSYPNSYITLDELSSSILAKPHSYHTPKNDFIDDLIIEVCNRIEEDYRANPQWFTRCED